jgi:hypothetical protein
LLIENKILREKANGSSLIIKNVKNGFHEWINEAEKRIFSIASGTRLGIIGPHIMKIGFAKTLFSANELGLDIENIKPFVFFCPDGTITFNPLRLQRGFTYGCIINSDFDGLINPTSMPNGCGFSIYELHDDMDDDERKKNIQNKQKELGKEHITQLGKGNHFAAVYNVLDPTNGEDTSRRFVVVHCSGHAGTEYLYQPANWLKGENGFHEIHTPHGPLVLLENFAKEQYLDKYFMSDSINALNRTQVMNDVFGENNFKILEEINHQGLSNSGDIHKLGAQIHDGLQPIAFNAEEGLIAVKTKNNLNSTFIDKWKIETNADKEIYKKELSNLDVTPHGGGYELRYPFKSFSVNLDKEGIRYFELNLKDDNGINIKLEGKNFREIREYITFRRKLSIMANVFKADMVEHIFDLQPNKQIYPLVSIPGGSH